MLGANIYKTETALEGGLTIGLPHVLNFANEELKNRVVPGCLSGDKFIAEPCAGPNVANLKTNAEDMGDQYILNGEKKWITQGACADYYTVACRTGGEVMGGISLLLVGRTMPGVTARYMDVQGMWGSGTSYITFEDVKSTQESHHWQGQPRLGIFTQANHLARICIEESLKVAYFSYLNNAIIKYQYSLKRKTFGQCLIEHALVRNKFGRMIRQCEVTHAWLESVFYQLHTLPDNVTPNLLAGTIALLKAQSTQTFEYCAREAAQHIQEVDKVKRLNVCIVKSAYSVPGGSEEIMLDLGIRQALKQAMDATNKPKL